LVGLFVGGLFGWLVGWLVENRIKRIEEVDSVQIITSILFVGGFSFFTTTKTPPQKPIREFLKTGIPENLRRL